MASDTAKVTVIDTGDPFEVTSQNIENQMLVSGSTESVTWNVAGTTGSEINSQYVDIMLSTDGVKLLVSLWEITSKIMVIMNLKYKYSIT